jgi:hypothetical protein
MVGYNINNIDLLSVIAIADAGDYAPHPNIYNMAILQPSTDILMRWADCPNAMQAGALISAEYRQYLSTPDCDEIIVSILAALCKKDIMIYIPAESFDIFGMVFIDHIYQMYGIMCGLNFNGRFYVNPNNYPFILSKFYEYSFISAQLYIEKYPSMMRLPDWVINKLAIEMKPTHMPVDFQWYVTYFNDLNSKTVRPLNEMVTLIPDRGGKI